MNIVLLDVKRNQLGCALSLLHVLTSVVSGSPRILLSTLQQDPERPAEWYGQ